MYNYIYLCVNKTSISDFALSLKSQKRLCLPFLFIDDGWLSDQPWPMG
jgi:hypothetical protein